LKGFELKFYYPDGKLGKFRNLMGKSFEEVYFEDGSLRNIDSQIILKPHMGLKRFIG
jgi:hypothetical protein